MKLTKDELEAIRQMATGYNVQVMLSVLTHVDEQAAEINRLSAELVTSRIGCTCGYHDELRKRAEKAEADVAQANMALPAAVMHTCDFMDCNAEAENMVQGFASAEWFCDEHKPSQAESGTPSLDDDPPVIGPAVDYAAKPKCQICGKPATCHGTYEGHTGYGCDDCCGHGNEDGHCEPVQPAVYPAIELGRACKDYLRIWAEEDDDDEAEPISAAILERAVYELINTVRALASAQPRQPVDPAIEELLAEEPLNTLYGKYLRLQDAAVRALCQAAMEVTR